MNDEAKDAKVRQLIRDYNAAEEPSAERREAMWTAIQARKAAASRPGERWRENSRRFARRASARWMWSAAAAAAVLAVGIGIGQRLGPGSSPERSAETVTEPAPRWRQETAEALYRLAARDYLRTAEARLARFQNAATQEEVAADDPMTDWAGKLLVQTRLLMDSPAGEDPELRSLFRDLEVALARMVQLVDEPSAEQRQNILEGLQRQAILRRLREEMPPRSPEPQPAIRS